MSHVTNDAVPPALRRASTVAHVLDGSLRLPGTQFRFGLDPLFGLVPVIGDSIATVGSLYIVLVGVSLRAPPRLIATMLLLIGIDWLLGSIPVLGTILDAFLKVNQRNVALLESFVENTDTVGRI